MSAGLGDSAAAWGLAGAASDLAAEDEGRAGANRDAGSDAGGHSAAAMYTLIETAKVKGIDPRAWLSDVLTLLGAPCQAHQRASPVELVTNPSLKALAA